MLTVEWRLVFKLDFFIFHAVWGFTSLVIGGGFCPLQLECLISPETRARSAWRPRSWLRASSILNRAADRWSGAPPTPLIERSFNSISSEASPCSPTWLYPRALKRQRWLKETALAKGKEDEEGSLCLCVCVCHSHSALLHVSLFIPQSFGHLTKTNDSASEMSSRLRTNRLEEEEEEGEEEEGERDWEKVLQSRLVPLFSVWLCPLAWRFEMDLGTLQTWIHG